MRKLKEFIIGKLILISGLASIFFVVLIFLFLLREGLSVFKIVTPFNFLLGKNWYPISEPPQFGILPLILGSVVVTIGAAVISIPIGVGCAIYIAEVAPSKTKEVLKAGIDGHLILVISVRQFMHRHHSPVYEFFYIRSQRLEHSMLDNVGP